MGKQVEDLIKKLGAAMAQISSLKNVNTEQVHEEATNPEVDDQVPVGKTANSEVDSQVPERTAIVKPTSEKSVQSKPRTAPRSSYADIVKANVPDIRMLPEGLREKSAEAKKRINDMMFEKRNARASARRNARAADSPSEKIRLNTLKVSPAYFKVP